MADNVIGFIFLGLLSLLFLFICYISAAKATRTRHQLLERLQKKREGGGGEQQQEEEQKVQRPNILIIHDGAREERLKKGHHPTLTHTITRQRVDSLFLPSSQPALATTAGYDKVVSTPNEDSVDGPMVSNVINKDVHSGTREAQPGAARGLAGRSGEARQRAVTGGSSTDTSNNACCWVKGHISSITSSVSIISSSPLPVPPPSSEASHLAVPSYTTSPPPSASCSSVCLMPVPACADGQGQPPPASGPAAERSRVVQQTSRAVGE